MHRKSSVFISHISNYEKYIYFNVIIVLKLALAINRKVIYMSEDKESIKFVNFVYKESEECRTHFVNGAMGRVSPRGDFEFSLFFEHADMPIEQKMKVEEGKLTEINEDTDTIIIRRDIKTSIIMAPEQAEILGNWLVDAVRNYRSNTKSDKNE